MAKNGFKVADSDMHVFEPADLWQRYIDPSYRHVAPVGLTEMRRDMRVRVKSHVILRLGAARPLDPASGSAWRDDYESAYAESRRLEVPGRGRLLPPPAAVRGLRAQDPVGQLAKTLRPRGGEWRDR